VWSASINGQDLLVELDRVRARVGGIDGERVAEGGQLSWQVVHISGVLVDLGMMPIWDIPQLLKRAREVLSAVDLALKHLQEALASGASLWD
jgi:hypothetical protein